MRRATFVNMFAEGKAKCSAEVMPGVRPSSSHCTKAPSQSGTTLQLRARLQRVCAAILHCMANDEPQRVNRPKGAPPTASLMSTHEPRNVRTTCPTVGSRRTSCSRSALSASSKPGASSSSDSPCANCSMWCSNWRAGQCGNAAMWQRNRAQTTRQCGNAQTTRQCGNAIEHTLHASVASRSCLGHDLLERRPRCCTRCRLLPKAWARCITTYYITDH
jgi:hypothetical protein